MRGRRCGFTPLELAISLALVSLLLAVLLPALASARVTSHRDQCSSNQRLIGQAWEMYLQDYEGEFPCLPTFPGWHYGGVRFSPIGSQPFLDTTRPLTPYLSHTHEMGEAQDVPFCCPADHGITGIAEGVGTGDRTAYRAFGISYRANAKLLDASKAGLDGRHRGLRLSEVSTVPSRLVLMGDPIWYEIYEKTDRLARWHGDDNRGNLLFLDGSVRFMEVLPKTRVGPAVVEPRLAQDSRE